MPQGKEKQGNDPKAKFVERQEKRRERPESEQRQNLPKGEEKGKGRPEGKWRGTAEDRREMIRRQGKTVMAEKKVNIQPEMTI